jgi:hypothetical protein
LFDKVDCVGVVYEGSDLCVFVVVIAWSGGLVWRGNARRGVVLEATGPGKMERES